MHIWYTSVLAYFLACDLSLYLCCSIYHMSEKVSEWIYAHYILCYFMNQWLLLHNRIKLIGYIKYILPKGIFTIPVKWYAIFSMGESISTGYKPVPTQQEIWGPPCILIHAGRCLPRWTRSHIVSLHSLVWKKAFLSGLYSTTTHSGPMNFWTRAVRLHSGRLSHPPMCPHSELCPQATEASLLNHKAWGSATAQTNTHKTISPLYKVVHLESHSWWYFAPSATQVTYKGGYISYFCVSNRRNNQAERGAHTKYFDLIIWQDPYIVSICLKQKFKSTPNPRIKLFANIHWRQ